MQSNKTIKDFSNNESQFSTINEFLPLKSKFSFRVWKPGYLPLLQSILKVFVSNVKVSSYHGPEITEGKLEGNS